MTTDPEREAGGCEEFQLQLVELLQAGEDARDHPHLRSCERCRALLDDLEKIAEAARRLFGSEY
jgi:hypothetical protein